MTRSTNRINTIRRPLVYLLIAYLAGVVWGCYLPCHQFLLIAILVPMILGAAIALKARRNRCTLILVLFSSVLLGNLFIAGKLSPPLPPNHLSRYLSSGTMVLEGVLYKAPQNFPEKTRCYVLTEKIIKTDREIPVSGKLILTVRQPHVRFSYGDRVRFSCRVRLPKNFNNPGSFNYQRYLAFQGIFVTASLDSKHAMVKVGEHPCNPLLSRIEHIREMIQEFFYDQLSSPADAIATALLTGEQSGIDQEIRDLYSITGVSHVLAISGLHIGIIALISFFLINACFRCSTRLILMTDISKLAAALTILPVIMYCLIAGAGIAALRATAMVITYLVAILIDRQNDMGNTLALAAFIILILSPSSLFDCSFQLSFMSVAAILYLNPRFSFTFFKESASFPGLQKSWYHALLARVTSVLTMTLSALLGTVPLVALHFNRCSLWSIPANLIVVPLTGFLIVPLGLISSLLVFIAKPLAVVTAGIIEVLIRLSNAVVAFFSGMPHADFRISTPTLPEIILYYAGIILLVKSRNCKWARLGLVIVIALFLADGGYWYYQIRLNPRLRITSIDVGQGESTLLQFPGGKTMLIDGGGFYDSGFDTGDMVVSPVLWHKKIRRIDILVLSHAHPDHLNGLVSVIKHFDIGEVWTNGQGIETEAYAAFDALIGERKIKKKIVSRGHPHYKVNGVAIEFLHPGWMEPDHPGKISSERLNNSSLVIRLCFGEVSVIFTGDIYAADESEIMALHPGIKSTIMKIPHHGSATSSSKPFIEMLSPRIALLSVGSDNSFNLPHPDVISRYEKAGCRILRTDRDGAICLEIDGSSSVKIRTHLQSLRAGQFRPSSQSSD